MHDLSGMRKRLAIITSHPIQYNAPIFKLLATRNYIDIKVFYTWGDSVLENKYDPGFNKSIQWDIPLLEGYPYEFLKNISSEKGTHHFKGIVNPDIIERIDDFFPDAILIYGWSFQSHLKAMRHYKKKKKIIFRGDSTLIDKQPLYKEFIRSLFLKWVYHYVDYALYVGKNNYDYFKKSGLKTKQLVYAPHAVDNDRFSDNDVSYHKQAEALRQKMDITSQRIVFLFAGKLEEKKDPIALLKSFVQSGADKFANLVIVGNGVLEKQLKEEYGNFPSIFFLEFQNQSQMPVIYHLADVFVLPSKGPGETWGLSVNEAMACGLPVLVSNKCGCAPDLVSNSENGYIFKANDIDDLSSKLKLFIEAGKAGLKKMGECSKKKIADFSFEKFCEATENLLLHS
jgi:glycosyltransferase involved in cell wall biosynthesis